MATKKTTNFESCRNLQGQRLGVVNESRRLAEYLEGEEGREKERQDRIQEKIKEGMREPEKKRIRFEEEQYQEENEEILESVASAVQIAMAKRNSKNVEGLGTIEAASSSGVSNRSRHETKLNVKAKKVYGWLFTSN